MSDNVCLFISEKKSFGDLYIFHYVYETEKQIYEGWTTLPYYRMGLVLEGEGVLFTQSGEFSLKKGDLFFCLPGVPYIIKWKEAPICAYIGCIGDIAAETVSRLKIDSGHCVFSGYGSLSFIFEEGKRITEPFLYNYCRGLFLTATGMLGADIVTEKEERVEYGAAKNVRKYVEENFSDPALTLESMCKKLSYNTKYISSVFKKAYKISFRAYLNTVRITNACALINKGFVGIKDISFLSGFSDPLYFSKVFKSHMGKTPTKFLLEHGTKEKSEG